MVNSVTNLKPANGLAVLQAQFALSSIGGVIRVIDLDEVGRITSGADGVYAKPYTKRGCLVT